MFEEGYLDVTITDINAVGDGSGLHTTRNMLAIISQDPIIKIAGIELVGMADNGLAEMILTTDGTQYTVEISDTIQYDTIIDKNSHNGIANSAVAFALEQIESRQQLLKTENLFSLNRTTNVKLVADDVNTIRSLGYPLCLTYAGKIDKKNIRVPVGINNGANGGNQPYIGEDFILSCVIDGVPLNVTVQYVDDNTMIANTVQAYNPDNPNVKYLTTPGLFNRGRNSSYGILNSSDQTIINSLFNGNYAKTQLYYVGEPNGDYGICPVSIYGNVLDYPSSEGSDGENIYLTILQDVGIPVFEVISMNYDDNLFYIIQPDAKIQSLISIYASLNSVKNGYIKYHDGTMIVQGTATVSPSVSKVTLPITFINSNYQVVCSVMAAGTPNDRLFSVSIDSASKSATEFHASVTQYMTSGINRITSNISYIAIGRWK